VLAVIWKMLIVGSDRCDGKALARRLRGGARRARHAGGKYGADL